MNYKDSGVDIEEATSALNMSKKYIVESYNKQVLSNVGSYGGMFDISNLDVENPVLVSSTDSIGTKIDLAIKHNMLDYVGYDIVNHSINDILVQGAKPLYFLEFLLFLTKILFLYLYKINFLFRFQILFLLELQLLQVYNLLLL